MPDDSPAVAVDSRPRLSGIMDTINASSAHGPATRLPPAFYDADVKRIVERIGVDEWFAGYRESREYRALGIGSLLGDVVSRMVASAEHAAAAAPSVRLCLSGCHDTTLAATLASLGAFETDEWPPFTSHVAIELFRDAKKPLPSRSAAAAAAASSSSFSPSAWLPAWLGGSSSSSFASSVPRPGLPAEKRRLLDGYYVRIRYNDAPVTVPGCRAPGKHLDGDESFCTLEAFKAIVDKFTPSDWRQQCRSNLKAPAFPSEPEPAGF